jgi:putative ABC transport system substrate-binding protein
LHDVREAAQTLGLQVNVLHASTDDEINAAFRTMVQQQTAALVLAADPFFDTRRSSLWFWRRTICFLRFISSVNMLQLAA